MNEVSYERVKDIDFSSSKKFNKNLDQKINSLEDKAAKPAGNYRIPSSYKAAPPSAEEIGTLFTKLGNCKTKAVALSLIPAYADQFVAESRAVPVVTDLFNTENLDMNFSLTRCGLFINKEHPFLHTTPDFLTQCDCCGLGCGEVKNPLTSENGEFEKYATHKHSCLEKKDGKFALKRTHDYYYQVQQQLFTLPERKHNDFVVCGVDAAGNGHLFTERILPDTQHWDRVVPKLELFWRPCILPEILGRWYTRRLTAPVKMPEDGGICFCHAQPNKNIITCSNSECP